MTSASQLLLLLALAQAPERGAPASTPAPPSSAAVIIHTLRPLGTDPDIARRLEEMLHAEVGRLRQVSLIEACRVGVAGEECEGRASCLASYGEVCGASKVVYGTVATLGESYVLDLKLIDVATRAEERRLSTRLSGEQAVLIDGVRSAAAQLLVPDQYVGTLHVQLEEPGAQIFLDGGLVGETPLAPLTSLEPGKHGLKIVLAGYRDFDRFVDVYFDRVTVVEVSLVGSTIDATISAEAASGYSADHGLAPRPLSPLLMAGVGAVALGAITALAGGGALALVYADMSQHTRDVDGVEVVEEPEQYDRRLGEYQWWPLGWILIGAGSVVGVAGAAAAVIDLQLVPTDAAEAPQ